MQGGMEGWHVTGLILNVTFGGVARSSSCTSRVNRISQELVSFHFCYTTNLFLFVCEQVNAEAHDPLFSVHVLWVLAKVVLSTEAWVLSVTSCWTNLVNLKFLYSDPQVFFL